MSAPDDADLNQSLVSFLAGDARAGAVLFAKTKKPILDAIRARVSDLRNDHDDILSEVFVLVMEAPGRFDPSRGSALSYIKAVLMPEAIRRVRAKSARPGSRTRRETVKSVSKPVAPPTFPILDPVLHPETVPIVGFGSPESMEAACDAHVLWLRAPPLARATIEGLMESRRHVEIATELSMDRFRVARAIKALRRLANAA